jgi:hypothetical protein
MSTYSSDHLVYMGRWNIPGVDEAGENIQCFFN